MGSVTKLIHKRIQERRVALGNSKTGLKDVCSDLLNEDIGHNRKQIGIVADGCFLSPVTIERVMDCDEFYRPMSDTVERIMRYYNCELSVEQVSIKPRFRNIPKTANADEEGVYE